MDSEILKKFLFEMDAQHRQSAITRICDCCGVSRPTVRNWYKGRSPIRVVFKAAINIEFNKKIFDL